MYLFQKIEEMSVHYHDARKNIAEFLLNERSGAVNYSMQDIAARTYTSKATLSRFAQKAGYEGWIPFMEAFLKEAKYIEEHFSDIDPNFPFTKEDNTSEMIRKLSVLQKEAVDETVHLLEDVQIEKAGDMILKANRTVVFGMKPNSLIAGLFQTKMENIGMLVHVADTDHGGTVARALSEQDLAIIVSYSGNNPSRTPMRYVLPLKNRNVPIIGVTSEGNSYLRENSDCVLTIASQEHLYTKIASFYTEQSETFLFNALFSYCFKKNYDHNYESKLRNSRILEMERQGHSKE